MMASSAAKGLPRRMTRRITAGYPKSIDDRLERIHKKFDEHFARVDVRSSEVDGRVDAAANTMLEAWRADVKRFYELVRAHGENVTAHLDRFDSQNVARIADLHRAIAELAPRVRKARRSR